MAKNIVNGNDRRWIEKTYRQSPERDALQNWVDTHPGATSIAEISAGLKAIMDGWNDTQKNKISKHFSGQAFDVLPVTNNADEIKDYIRELPHLANFLDHEGGLVVWHADFDTP
jgi:hypothetical protein